MTLDDEIKIQKVLKEIYEEMKVWPDEHKFFSFLTKISEVYKEVYLKELK
jgi:hypothetical protein